MPRITGGEWRGRRLEVAPGIRPTTELARKAAFDMLGDAIRGARVLDACAGSGAYGLEALSRGAAHATFVEADRKVAEILRGNVERLRATDATRIEVMSVDRFSSKVNGDAARPSAPRGPGRRGASADHSPSKKFADRDPSAGIARFDVVFHDPPFAENSDSDVQLLLGLVRPGGWLVHERGDAHVPVVTRAAAPEVRRYGRTRILLFAC